MTTNYKKISIIVPCRNEEKFIDSCINSIVDNDYPKELTEVFIIDGISTDNTQNIINQYVKKFQYIKLLLNPQKTVPFALNKGIEAATGDFIIRLDAHSIYPKNYFSQLIYFQQQTNADNIGGVWITQPANNSLTARVIAIATSSGFGIGNAQYRLKNTGKEPFEVDTVPFGCYKKEVFKKIGLFEPELTRNQDDEFNARLIKNGGKIILVSSIEIQYFARENLYKTFKMFYQYGLFKPLVNKKIGTPATIRQFIPLFFVLFLFSLPFFIFLSKITAIFGIFILVLYFSLSTLFSIKIAFAKKDFLLLSVLPLVFFIIHFSYGIGYIKGIFKFLIFNEKNITIQSSR
jgi:glycosyltransferase involved in cell wall biosynthesis